jgi:hypothetical protein
VFREASVFQPGCSIQKRVVYRMIMIGSGIILCPASMLLAKSDPLWKNILAQAWTTHKINAIYPTICTRHIYTSSCIDFKDGINFCYESEVLL